jgi:hypothetical protein
MEQPKPIKTNMHKFLGVINGTFLKETELLEK